MEPRFIVGPPGTGKTYRWIVKKYKELLAKYGPDNIICLSHTNEAVRQLLNAIMKLDGIKGEYDEEFFEHRICTIHHYCKQKLFHRKVIDEDDPDHIKELSIRNTGFRLSKEKTIKKHPFFRFLNDAYGNGRELEEHWYHPNTDHEEYKASASTWYRLHHIITLNEVYVKYKKDEGLYDFADMIDEFNSLIKESDIEALIVDEAQDSNVPQLRAIKKMAKNVKEEHFYLVGDPDQTIFEFAGSDADYFHRAAANPYEELEQGLRCGRAINTFCKEIISPVWEHYGYKRKWLPAKYDEEYHGKRNLIPEGCKAGDIIEGRKYELTDLNPSKNLAILLDKMRNTKQTFIFAYRGYPSNIYITDFLKHYGFEFAHVGSRPHVSKKELRCHKEWPEFINGEPKSLKQIKDFLYYLGNKAVVHGKGKFKFEDWIKRDYTYTELINARIFLPDLRKEFDLLRKRHKGTLTKKVHDDRMIYIKKVLKNGVDLDGDVRIKHGSIHIIKGATFDNVVGDLSIYRFKAETFYIQRRLKYTMFSRGIFDCWVIKATSPQARGLLGDYGHVPRPRSWSIDEDRFHRRWRPDWDEIENPDDNERRKINENKRI